MSSFPSTLADLKAGDEHLLSSQSFYDSLKELRRSTLSINNRLRSVLEDANFVQEVAAEYELPLIANERCGSWYIPPAKKAGSAYFKSTDGHTGQWGFSLRRLNLQVLDIVAQHGGCILVDSTRRGKVMPDAFSKTVPIWCAVMNRVLFPEQRHLHHFQRPAIDLPASEIAQIESRLDGFVTAFRDLGVDLNALRQKLGRPLRLQWVVGHSTRPLLGHRGNATGAEETACHNFVLCSASRRVKGAEMSENGYIQGAGDDSEGWSQGLTPTVFWRNTDVLLQAQAEDLSELIKKLLLEDGRLQRTDSATLIEPTKNLYVGVWTGLDNPTNFDLVINCHSREPDAQDNAKQLNLKCGTGKLGSRDLRRKLYMAKSHATSVLERNPSCRILITCETGKDLSVGIALMLCCIFYSDDGKCILENHKAGMPAINGLKLEHDIDKRFIRQRLAWIISSKPDTNPSRSTLQAVNAYLIDRP